MEQAGRKVGSIVLVVLIAYFLLGLVGVLPAQYDVIRRAQGTQVEYGEEILYPIPTSNSEPYDLTINKEDGNIYFVEFTASNIGIMEADGNIQEYPTPSSNSYPLDILFNDIDNSVYYAEYIGQRIGELRVGITHTEHNSDYRVFQMVLNPSNNKIYATTRSPIMTVFDCEIKSFTYYNYPFDSSPRYLTLNEDNNCIYYTNENGNTVGKMTVEGDFTEWELPTPSSYPRGITYNHHDGNLYIIENLGQKIAKMTPNGAFTEYEIPLTGDLQFIQYNPIDNCLYFGRGDKIGKMTENGEFEFYVIEEALNEVMGLAIDENSNVYFTITGNNVIGKLPALPPAPSVPPTSGEFSFTQVGQWNQEGDGRAPFEYVGEQIPITVEIETNETIETASLLWQDVGESDWNFGDMAQGQDGAWRFSIPKQEREGTVYYQVQATTSEGGELFSDTYGVQVLTTAETPAPSEPLVNPTVFYGVGTLLLVAVGVAINAPSKKWK